MKHKNVIPRYVFQRAENKDWRDLEVRATVVALGNFDYNDT